MGKTMRTASPKLSATCLCAMALGILPGVPRAWASDAHPGIVMQAIGPVEGLDIGASVRLRYETLDNEFRPGFPASDDIVVLRTLVHASYDSGPVRLAAELQDARAYDTNVKSPVSTTEVDAMELIQAYVGFDIGDRKAPAVAIDLGRFSMDVGSRRLVARNAFRNSINGFTGARAMIHGPSASRLLLFYTMPQVRLPSDKAGLVANKVEWDRESGDLVFWGGNLDLPLGKRAGALGLGFFGLQENDRADLATRDRQLYTADLRFGRKPAPGKLDWDLEAAYQFGSISASTSASAPRLAVEAWFAHAGLGYEWSGAWKPRVALFYDLATGDGKGAKYTRFDTLFGARRSDFGPTSIYGALGRANISSPGMSIEASPTARWNAMVAGRLAWLDSASDSFASTGVRDATGTSGRFAGEQVEARLRYWLIPGALQAEGGGAILFDGHFLEHAPNANGNSNPVYGYMQLELTL